MDKYSPDLSFEQIEENIRRSPVLSDLSDDRDYRYERIIMGAGTIELPAQFSLREIQSPVKNQGSRGTCTSFASVALSEFFNRRELNISNLDLSEEYFFKRIKEFDIIDYGYAGYGAYLRSAAKALKKYGTCLESTFPYKPNSQEDIWQSETLTKEMDAEALQYRMKDYISVPATPQYLKESLFISNSPVLVGVNLYKSYRKAKTNGGFIPIANENEELIGGHAMLLVGYLIYEGKEYYIFKNSWGSSWGDKGYLYWPIVTGNPRMSLFSAWSFIDLENNPNVMPEWNPTETMQEGKEKGITNGERPYDPITRAETVQMFLNLIENYGLTKKG